MHRNLLSTFRSFGFSSALVLASTAPAFAQWYPPNPVTGVSERADGVELKMQTGVMRLQICSDSIVHVLYSPTGTFPERKEFVIVKDTWPKTEFTTHTTEKEVTLTTARLKIAVDREDSTVVYSDLKKRPLLQEGPKTMEPAQVNGEQTWSAEDVVKMYGSPEALYGLGQHQAGVWNYRGESVDVSQENTNVAVPFLLSTNGYGIFWNNTSASRFNNRFVHYLYISSQVADVIDYYFIYGPDFDKIIASYRELTGAAPLFGKWAYGFWQCKNKYQTQQELLGVAKKYRDLHIPMDNIVQDWFWWTNTGEFKFNSKYPNPTGMVKELHGEHVHLMMSVWPYFYPGSLTYDDMDKRGFFIDRTKSKSFHPLGMALYDAFNPEARKYYWNLIDQSLFQIGADAWWMDTTEPETEGREKNLLMYNKTAIGSGARYSNIYPLMTTRGVYEGQRAASDEKRVFILSRSSFAGGQRYAVSSWSGDILSDWESYKRQIPAGLNLALSGIPYWTTDIGGFIGGNPNPNDPAFRELFIRWFEYGAFCPIFRVHGTRTTNENELWAYGAEAQTILTNYDRLRYRLMPYIYSVAWKVTNEGYTPMRPLVMDFQDDVRAQNTGDQFLYGPAILVNPVTEAGATSRRVYLPKADWYDFWTGAKTTGGKAIDAAAPLDRMPLYVRAGSILPLGPDMEWSTEKPADPIELRVYPGADGDFTLYEDENDSYRYEKGVYATIPIHWDDKRATLTIGKRQGSFPGMLQERKFQVVYVSDGHGADQTVAERTDKEVKYSGETVKVAR
jgi:alpha-D-xyloside xylohydrolase